MPTDFNYIPTATGDNCLTAWKAGCRHIIENSAHEFHLITTIKNPSIFDKTWLSGYNPRSLDSSQASLSDVINTIFPYKLDRFNDREKMYSKYKEIHEKKYRLAGKKKKRWGTYFARMIDFGPTHINQIEEIITVLQQDNRHLRTLNPIHISSASEDSLRKRLGNPCLQLVEFLQPEAGTIDLLAVYRNHDFLNKALGNFIGLGKLLDFVATHSGRNAGRLICHSAQAYTDSKSKLKRIAGIGQEN